jgi:hypothetical protein
MAENVGRTVMGVGASVLPDPASGEQARALWRNLAIVGLDGAEVIAGIRARMRTAYDEWMGWLGSL